MAKFRNIILILSALMIITGLPSYAAAEELTITSAEDLRNFRDAVNKGDNFAGDTILLSADVDLKGEPWIPIGTDAAPFDGKFNGGGHTISGLNVTTATMKDLTVAGAQGKGGGLFLNVEGEGAQIANLKVEGTIDAAPSANALAAGGIAARLGPGTVIYRCLNRVSVTLGGTGTGRESNAYAGGAAGYSEGYLIYCVNKGAVTASVGTVYIMAGGIAGGQRGGGILFSDNDAPVAAQEAGGYRRAYAGGIAGSAESTSISGVRNQQAVSSYTLAGGITAFAMDSVLRDAVNTASVSCAGQDRSDATAGGITAQLYNGSAAVNCCNTGNVATTGSPSYSYTGGIAGWSSAGFYASNKIYNCTNSGAVSGSASSSARTGGLVGELDKTELYSSVSSGAVSATPAAELGGIAGYKSPQASVHDAAYSGSLPPIGFGDRNAARVQNLSAGEIASFVATAFPSLDPEIVQVPVGSSDAVNVKLTTHPGKPAGESAYFSIESVYTDPAGIAAAEAAEGSISITGTSPGAALLAAYVETYRSGLDGGVDRASPSRSLVSALVWVTEEGGAGVGGVPPLWPDGVLPPEVPGEPETGMGWDERFPRHSCSGGCNSGWGTLALLALVPLAFVRIKRG